MSAANARKTKGEATSPRGGARTKASAGAKAEKAAKAGAKAAKAGAKAVRESKERNRRRGEVDRSGVRRRRGAPEASKGGLLRHLLRRRSASRASAAAQGNRRLAPKPAEAADEPPRPRVPVRARWAVLRERARMGWNRARRPLGILARVALTLLVIGGAVAIGRLVEKHVRTSPAFEITDIELEGTERLSRDAVLSAAGLAEGNNVFEIGPEDAEARLRAHPWIATAEVERRLPGTFRISLREHHAAALLSLPSQADGEGVLYLVGEDGSVFKRLGPDDPVDLPVVTGIDRARFTRDRAWRTQVLLEVVALLHDYRGAGLWSAQSIGEVHVESDGGLSLFVGNDATHVRLGHAPFREKLGRLRRVLDRLEEREAQPAYVYLDNERRPDRVTVRLR